MIKLGLMLILLSSTAHQKRMIRHCEGLKRQHRLARSVDCKDLVRLMIRNNLRWRDITWAT